MSKMLRKDLFVLRHSLRRRSHLSDPVINNIRDLALPRESVYHFMDPTGMVLGPRVSDPLMQKVEGIRYVDHLTEYYKPDVTPIRKLGTNITSMITEYRSKNRSFRRMMDPVKNGTDPKALLIYNYSMISAAYGFPRSLRASWYEFRAQMNTLIKNINDTAKLTDRSHFFILDLPDELPALSDLVNGVRNFSNTTLRTIPTFEDKFIFEMFKWIGRGNKDSLFNNIEKKHYAKINIIFKRLDKWIVVNLAWISDLSQNFNKAAIFDARRMETAFIKLLSDLHLSGRPYDINIQEVDDTEGDDDEIGEDDTVDTVTATDKSDDEDITEEEKKELESLDINKLLSFKDDESDTSIVYSDDELDKIENELMEIASRIEDTTIIELDDEELDSLVKDLTDGPVINTDILSEISGFEPDVNASVALAGELNSKGIISNNEYNRIVRISERFNDIPDPYDLSKMLADTVSDIDVSELEIDEVEGLDEKVLLDKSLGRAKIDQFENEYRNGFLKKDILECISAIQKGPISITDYTVEKVENSQNKHEIHTIKVTPVVGRPSTIRQMLPVVDDDGTFKYNGTSYRMKMQRVDMPIRKISDVQVALNSYYGKLFVELSTKSVNNYSGRFVNWIKAKIIDHNDKDFTDGYIKASESNDPRLPLVYGSISGEIERFKIIATKTDVCFNFEKRFDLLKLDKEEISKLEGRKYTVFGKSRDSLYFIDKNGIVFEYKDSDLTELGTLESFLGIEQSRLPTPQVGMKIYSKTIPIGFCLAYLIGFDNLIKLLKVKVRRVNMGERPTLSDSEYMIKFRNQTLILDRTNVLHTMIMSGFNEYSKYIKDYDIGMFDTKDVYSAIMDRAGIGNRYMKKLSSTSIYFIDPITEKILRMMNEPTVFIDLIIRACSMLVTSYIPKEVDGARGSAKGLTRLRGYDRIAGFAYENIVKAIEQQSMSPNAGRTGISLNPWDTMNIIRSDPTVAPVDNLNPVQYLREREVVTHTGRGGRNKRSMVARSRLFTDQDTGVISEATVDSGDVGVIVYASQDSDIRSVYGTTGESKPSESLEAGRLLSSAALLSPNADGDDQNTVLDTVQVRLVRDR